MVNHSVAISRFRLSTLRKHVDGRVWELCLVDCWQLTIDDRQLIIDRYRHHRLRPRFPLNEQLSPFNFERSTDNDQPLMPEIRHRNLAPAYWQVGKGAKPQRIEKKLERICASISVSFANWVNSFTLTIAKKT